jgi:hypothetical protein
VTGSPAIIERWPKARLLRSAAWRRLCLLLPVLVLFPRGLLASDDAGASYDNTGLGHLTAPSLSPGHILRPNAMFLLPRGYARGTWEADFDAHWANVFVDDPGSYLVDGEWFRLDSRLSYALKDGLSVGIGIPFIGRTGGSTDSLIEGFHDALRLRKGYRDSLPQNRSIIHITEEGETRTLADGDAWNIGDVSGFVVWQVARGGRSSPSVTLQMQASAPTGDADELQGLGEPSVAGGLLLSKRLWDSPFLAFGGAGLFYCPADDILGLRAMMEEHSGLLGLEYQYSRSLSLIVQNLSSSPVADDLYAFRRPTHELSAGVKWRFSKCGLMQFALTENVFIFDNSADIGVHLSFSELF